MPSPKSASPPSSRGRSATTERRCRWECIAPAPRLPAVDWDGLASRLFEVPLDAGNYSALASDDKRLYFLDQPAGEDASRLLSLAIDNKGDKPATFSEGIGQFALSTDRKRVLLQKWSERGNGDLYIVDAGAKAPDALDKNKLRVADWRLAIDPRAEWQQDLPRLPYGLLFSALHPALHTEGRYDRDARSLPPWHWDLPKPGS